MGEAELERQEAAKAVPDHCICRQLAGIEISGQVGDDAVDQARLFVGGAALSVKAAYFNYQQAVVRLKRLNRVAPNFCRGRHAGDQHDNRACFPAHLGADMVMFDRVGG